MRTVFAAFFLANGGRWIGLLRRQGNSGAIRATIVKNRPWFSPDEPQVSTLIPSQIVEILESASPRTRSIYLAYRAGCSYDEIAKHTGLTRNTIKRHIRRGLLAIMEHLANTAEPFD